MTLAAFGAGAIPIPFADFSIVISILTTTIVSIGKYYGYIWKRILKDDLLSIYDGKLYNKKENDDKKENTNYKQIIKLIAEIFGKGIIMMIALNLDDIIKVVYGVGTLIGMAIGAVMDSGIVFQYARNAKKYFESKCKSDDGTIFFITRCSEYEVIFRKFKEFENYDLKYPSY